MDLLKGLNEEQREAVTHESGPLLIVAGAGTGKTNVITKMFAWLVETKKAEASEILALTFTEKAATEMEERIDILLPIGTTDMWVTTFHSFCDRILREKGLEIGLDTGYTIMTEPEVWLFIRKHLFDFELKHFRPLGNPTKFIHALATHFTRAQDEDISPDDYLGFVKEEKAKIKTSDKAKKESLARLEEVAKAYKKYSELKTKDGKLDFGDLQMYALKLLRERPSVLKEYQDKFKHVLVDEFQDTNFAQNELVKMLVKDHQNVTVAADDDQSIYKFRGASIGNVLEFKESFPEAKIVVLKENYRSDQNILDVAYTTIQGNNPDRLEVKEGIAKKLIGTKGSSEKVKHLHAETVEGEAKLVVNEIIRLLKTKKYTPKDFAILVRSNSQVEPFLAALKEAEVTYTYTGSEGLFGREEIKDLIAFLNILNNFHDNVSLFRVLGFQAWRVDPMDRMNLLNQARKRNVSLFNIISSYETVADLKEESIEGIKKILKLIGEEVELINSRTAGQILYKFLADSGYLPTLLKEETPENQEKVLNFNAFFNLIHQFEQGVEDKSLVSFAEYIELLHETGNEPPAKQVLDAETVKVMTIHATKGLEFPVVFIVNLVSQRFPSVNRREAIELPEGLTKETLPKSTAHLQEERRLFYVGLTRAKEKLYLTSADYYEGVKKRKLSPFVKEALGVETPKAIAVDTRESKKAPVKPELTPFKPKQLSFSQISAYEICPRQYNYQYVMKIPVPPSAALSFGNTIHTTLKQFYRFIQVGEKLSKGELIDLFMANWISTGYRDQRHEEKHKELGEQMLTAFYARHQKDFGKPKYLEQHFKVKVGQDHVIAGYIDRIDELPGGGVEVIDYKTGKERKQREVDQDMQLTIYAIAAKEVLKEDPKKLSLYFLEPGNKLVTSRDKEKIDKAKEKIIDVAKKIETGDFTATPGFHCKFCDFRLLCDKAAY